MAKRFYLYFFEAYGLSPELLLAADVFGEIEGTFLRTWEAYAAG